MTGTGKSNIPHARLKIIVLTVVVLVHLEYSLVSAENIHKNEAKALCENNRKAISAENAFSWMDYLVLGSMLVISCGIGLFYGCFSAAHENSEDFLLGGSSMNTFPVAMSLAASFVTAVELLGNPAEMYTHGSQFWVICLAFIFVVPLTSTFYLPVFMNLRLTSSYEYLSMRFSRVTRYLASGLYIFQMVLYTSVAVYAPALALSRVTGLDVYLAVTAVYAVCIFYASQGGMKAVIIADTFQAGVVIGSILLIMFLARSFVGDDATIWSQSYYSDRLELFNFKPSLSIRHSFWSVVIGGTFYWMTMFCSNQASIQKYLSVENIAQVRKALWTSSIGLIIIYTVNFYTGMVLVAHYKDCDPMQSEGISADEILPLYIITVMGHLKGITGFFVAGIFAASLGTVASALNSLAAVTMEDFLGEACGVHLAGKKGAFVAKLLSIVYGGVSFGLVFIVAQLGSVMQVAISFNGMVGGISLGLFSLGMFFPWANSKGAIVGSLVAVVLITVMCLGQQISIANGTFYDDIRSVGTANCSCTVQNESKPYTEAVFILYRISYIWYSAIGFLVTICVGLTVSFATGATDPKDVSSELLSPPVRRFLNSLSDGKKEFLNIPLKENGNVRNKEVALTIKEAVNIGSDGEKTQNSFNEKIMRKIRKVSAPS